MQNDNNISIVKRPLWLLMALLCIVFSGASKRLLELRLDRQVNNHFPAGVLFSKKIKDGCRDKRHHLNATVYTEKHDPGRDGQGAALLPGEISFPAQVATVAFSHTNDAAQHQPVTSGVSLFLLHRRLQV